MPIWSRCPVFSIAFGDADWDELEAIGSGNARVFDGRDHLAEAFRAVDTIDEAAF